MRKVLSSFLAVAMILGCVFAFSGCKKPTFKVTTEEFYFSTDNGASYGNRRVEFEVGKSVYMQVVICIESSDKKEHEVSGELVIPDIKAVDAYYLKGQKITPDVDPINKTTTYPFTVTTNEEWTFFFEFVPNSVGKLEMELTFDDQVDEKYDMVNKIKLVEAVVQDDKDDDTED
ncbi:hypothetical protein SAMN02910264_02307 [Ruminococcaceae bacterium YAD3003]|nr:hypothetical protein SAMN02910264_02307 [Ruminococcaceae bacterium YAD3003]